MRRCLANFILLAGRQWQLRPYVQPRVGRPHYLYADWPANEAPVFGCELDLAHIAQRLQAQQEDLKKRLATLNQPLGRPLGQWIDSTNGANLQSFLAFSPTNLTQGRFLDYLHELKKRAPKESWFKKWHDQFDSDQANEVAQKFLELSDLWADSRSQDRPMLTITNASGTTNYFFAAWQLLKEREQAQEQLGQVQKRLVELGQMAYVGLCIVDSTQPATAVEMIRFGGL